MRGLISEAVRDPANAWSMGIFGVTGEFMWASTEPMALSENDSGIEIRTDRGAMRILTAIAARPVAYQSLWGDGEAWTSGLAFCLESFPENEHTGFHALGKDVHAIRSEDASSELFDLGLRIGHVAMYIRTRDTEILRAAGGMEGADLLSSRGVLFMRLLRAKSPDRIMVSTMGRIEIYAPIPKENGCSPMGPHTHLLPELAALKRRHSANTPIPYGLQAALTLHPRSPWRTEDGHPGEYDVTVARKFDELFVRFGDAEAKRIYRQVEVAVLSGSSPERFTFPQARHLRAQARIALRRLAQEGRGENIGEWLARYDRSASVSHQHAIHVFEADRHV